jgi:ribosome-associated protein
MIKVNNKISINENELKFDFIRASGPGGQNVNKVSTAVQLRFNIMTSKSLNEHEKALIIQCHRKKVTNEGILIIEAKKFRTQEKNKQDAVERLISLIIRCTKIKKPRRKTKIPKSVMEKRIEGKKRKADTKKLRKRVNKNFED